MSLFSLKQECFSSCGKAIKIFVLFLCSYEDCMVAALADAWAIPDQDNRKCDAIHQVTGFQIYTIGMTLKVKLVILTVRDLSWVRHNSCAPGFGSQRHATVLFLYGLFSQPITFIHLSVN